MGRSNKTTASGASVDAYIASRAKGTQADDARALIAMFSRITGELPMMWGPSIVGFGSYRYTYVSGRSGEAPLAGFAIRGRELCVYLDCEGDRGDVLAGLGRHRMGKSCLYFRQLVEIDGGLLEQLVVEAINAVRARYG